MDNLLAWISSSIQRHDEKDTMSALTMDVEEEGLHLVAGPWILAESWLM